MKIAYFFDGFYPLINGVMTATFNLAKNMLQRGHEVFYVAHKNPAYTPTRTEEGIEIYKVDSLLMTAFSEGVGLCLPNSRRVLNKLKREKVDIVHFTAPLTFALNAINHAKTLNIPCVQTFHTLWAEPRYFRYFFKTDKLPLQRVVWVGLNYFDNRSDVITAPSQYVIDQLKIYSPHLKPIYISNGINVEDFVEHNSLEELKKEYPAYNHKTFVYVGRLGKEKSIDIVIQAVAEAIKVDKEIKLFIVGGGPYYYHLYNLARSLKLKDHVFFTGKIQNKELIRKGFLHHTRAFVTASRTENQPMTILESIASQSPLILPKEKGVDELLEGNGEFFMADDYRELAQKMVKFAQDDKLYQKYKTASGQVSRKYDGRVVAEQFEKVYLAAITAKKARQK
jgi:glycosyltransferase involved in cell wall biosynthesis